MPIIPGLGRVKQVDEVFQANLGHRVIPYLGTASRQSSMYKAWAGNCHPWAKGAKIT